MLSTFPRFFSLCYDFWRSKLYFRTVAGIFMFYCVFIWLFLKVRRGHCFRRTSCIFQHLVSLGSFHQGLLQDFTCSRPLLAQVHDQSKKRCRHCLVSLELFQGILLIVLKSWGSCFGKTTAIVSNFEDFHTKVFFFVKANHGFQKMQLTFEEWYIFTFTILLNES